MFNDEFEVSMEGVSDLILICVAEKGMHVVVLQPCDLHQKAKGIAVDHLIPFEQCLRVGKWYNFIILAMCNNEEGVYLSDMVHEVEAIVLKRRVR